MPTLALLTLLAGSSEFRPDAQKVFAGCRAEAQGSNGRFYVCKGWSATIVTLFGNLSRAQVTDVTRSSQRTGLPGSMKEEELEETLGGQKTPVFRVTPNPVTLSDTWGFSDAVVIERAPTVFRMGICTARRASDALKAQCASTLEYFVAKGVPEEVDLERPPMAEAPAILGRKLPVPAGCKVESSTSNNGRIQCAGAMMTWTLIPDVPDQQKLAAEAAQMSAKMMGLEVAKERVPCRIEGTAAQCVRAFKTGLVLHVGVVPADKKSLMISCASNDTAVPFPPVCAGAIGTP